MAGMCPRDVAALAVVVWYLIVPSTHSDQLHPEYPLAQRVHLDSFDSAAECKKAGFEAKAAKANKGNFLETEHCRAWQCIATDGDSGQLID
jgi:hypothetical protein